MKIIKTKEQFAKEQAQKKIDYDTAHEGCDKCPGCGKKFKQSIYNFDIFTVRKRFGFTWKRGCKDRYRCESCGTIWESEPYGYI